MKKARVLCSIGTRPEAIKMAPVIEALNAEPWAEVRILATGQHRELLEDVNRVYAIKPDVNLQVMKENQSLPALTAELMTRVDGILEAEAPDVVLAQGDTTSVFITALAAFYRRIPFGHVEAGLRTHKMYYPFPEEINRVLADRLTAYHFAPTERAAANLRAEGLDAATIHVTGNTVIDALLASLEKARVNPLTVNEERRLILMTAHRRENFGPPFREVCEGVRELVDAVPDTELVYPVHPNPNVGRMAREVLGEHPRIRLVAPLNHLEFIAAMDASTLIVTDSGGIQEEAPSLGKPVLVFRDETERPEAVEAGVARLVGPHRQAILDAGVRLLTDPAAYAAMARGVSPFGDGHAARRIVEILARDWARGAAARGD